MAGPYRLDNTVPIGHRAIVARTKARSDVEIRIVAGKGFERFGSRFVLPRSYSVTIDDPRLPCIVTLDVKTGPRGPECRSAHFHSRDGDPSLSSSVLRAIPIAGMLKHTLPAMLATRGGIALAPELNEEEETALVDDLNRAYARRGAREDMVEQAAVIYRANVSLGAPTVAVAEELKYSRSQASRLIREARRRGLLGPATPGRAGEGSVR
jgi:hypothetical protein